MVKNTQGTIYWVTGLPGAGKTTLGVSLKLQLMQKNQVVIHLDGDALRDVYAERSDYAPTARKEIAFRNARLCNLVAGQGIDVVCTTVSMFHEVRRWNRANMRSYREIYLKVPLTVLVERDQKGLYSGASRGELANIPGLDCEFEEPEAPDHVFVNDGTHPVEYFVDRILETRERNAYAAG